MKKVPSGNLLLMTETSQHRQQLCRVSLNYLDSGHKFIGFIRPRLLKITSLFVLINVDITICISSCSFKIIKK